MKHPQNRDAGEQLAMEGQTTFPIKIAVLTNRTTSLSLSVLESLATSHDCALCHVFFYDTLANSRVSLASVLCEHGVKNTAAKVSSLVRRKAKSWICRSLGRTPTSFEFSHEFFQAKAIPFSIVASMNQPLVVEQLRNLEIDILLVCSCSQILKAPILNAARIASINVHPSLLPKYRGPVPIFWALYHREQETGVTFYLMTERIDAGEILAQFPIRIEPRYNEKQLSDVLFQEAGERVEAVLCNFVSGGIRPWLASGQEGSYQSFPSRQQRRALARRSRSAQHDVSRSVPLYCSSANCISHSAPIKGNSHTSNYI